MDLKDNLHQTEGGRGQRNGLLGKGTYFLSYKVEISFCFLARPHRLDLALIPFKAMYSFE